MQSMHALSSFEFLAIYVFLQIFLCAVFVSAWSWIYDRKKTIAITEEKNGDLRERFDLESA